MNGVVVCVDERERRKGGWMDGWKEGRKDG